jgi:acyl carrier protein
MTRDDLARLAAQTLDVKTIPPEAEMGKTRGWDSIAQVRLLLSIEEAAGVEIPPDMFGTLTSLAKIAGFLEDEGALSG